MVMVTARVSKRPAGTMCGHNHESMGRRQIDNRRVPDNDMVLELMENSVLNHNCNHRPNAMARVMGLRRGG